MGTGAAIEGDVAFSGVLNIGVDNTPGHVGREYGAGDRRGRRRLTKQRRHERRQQNSESEIPFHMMTTFPSRSRPGIRRVRIQAFRGLSSSCGLCRKENIPTLVKAPPCDASQPNTACPAAESAPGKSAPSSDLWTVSCPSPTAP